MATLADEFLEDLGELDGSDDEELVDEEEEYKRKRELETAEETERNQGQKRAKTATEEVKSNGSTAASEKERNLLAFQVDENMLKHDNIASITSLRKSGKLEKILERIDEQIIKDMQKRSSKAPRTHLEGDSEYNLIVECNQVILEITAEVDLLHKFLRDHYSEKFPELEQFVLHPLDYARVVKTIGNQPDLTTVDLSSILPANVIMVVSVAASTTSGVQLAPEKMAHIDEACDEALSLDKTRQQILEYIESRMTYIAPNLSSLVGTQTAAKLIGAAGGLVALSKLPANNVQSLGITKKTLAGFSSSTHTKTGMGYLTECDMVLKTPPSLRRKAIRLLSGKIILSARVDSFSQAPDGSSGAKFRSEIEKRLEKLQEPPPTKLVKALPAPIEKARKRRGGTRARKMKERYAQSELAKMRNRVAFGGEQDEIGLTGEGLGMIGKSGVGSRLRLSVNDKTKVRKKIQHNAKAIGASSGATSGLSSSLAFTPVQGLELQDPQQAARKEAELKALNARYFSASRGFSKVKRKEQETDQKMKE